MSTKKPLGAGSSWDANRCVRGENVRQPVDNEREHAFFYLHTHAFLP
jgi:hypothetical protein